VRTFLCVDGRDGRTCVILYVCVGGGVWMCECACMCVYVLVCVCVCVMVGAYERERERDRVEEDGRRRK